MLFHAKKTFFNKRSYAKLSSEKQFMLLHNNCMNSFIKAVWTTKYKYPSAFTTRVSTNINKYVYYTIVVGCCGGGGGGDYVKLPVVKREVMCAEMSASVSGSVVWKRSKRSGRNAPEKDKIHSQSDDDGDTRRGRERELLLLRERKCRPFSSTLSVAGQIIT